MVHWVYVVECDDDFIYVGETTRLYSRFIEHMKGSGSANTHRHRPRKLIGLYKVGDNQSFRNYIYMIENNQYYKDILDEWGEGGDHLAIENAITERFLWERRNNHEYGTGKEWYRVRGGKYTYKSLDDTLERARMWCSRPNRIVGSYKHLSPEITSLKEENAVDRPLCKCGYPSEVKLKKDGTMIYFVCPIPSWVKFDYLEMDEPCNFWKSYDGDKEVKRIFELNEKYRKEKWLDKLPITASRMEPDPCISCKTENYRPIWSLGSLRQLCEKCLAFKHDSLMKEYSKPKCLIMDD